jgi:hypothetical protein
MGTLAFQGTAKALSSDGLNAAATSIGVHAPEVWTVLGVETSGCGFLPDRRPQILFERHIFHRLTGGKYDDGQVSDPAPGGYGAYGAHQYDRLALAVVKDRNAALQSASWGIGQIMGMNYRQARFSNVEEMVSAMCASEDEQLGAFANFLLSSRLASALKAHDWTGFARGYDGSNYVINRYDVRLAGEYAKCSLGVLPDLTVRAAQLYLTYVGYHPGPIDGVAGVSTLSALAAFQKDRGMEVSPTIDDACVGQLAAVLTSAAAGVSA